MRRVESRLWLGAMFALVALVGACQTTAIPEPTRHSLPPSVGVAGAQRILLAAIANQPMPSVSAGTPSVDAGRLPTYAQMPRAAGGDEESVWIIEEMRPGVIRAGNRVRSHYLRVDVHYDDATYWLKIVGAEDLSYDGTQIHANALDWIQMLENRIAQYFGYYRALEQTRTPSSE